MHTTMRFLRSKWFKLLVKYGIVAFFIFGGFCALWLATLRMPDLTSFENRKVSQSTKIYDRTGTILLYDTGKNIKRTTVPLSSISPFIQRATIAIEDENFYNNNGIEPLSIVRAVIANITSGKYNQGASTITQQVVKNALLTTDKTITRKLKEWVLAYRLTKTISKDEILEIYLNEMPYGGTMYGAEEASQSFFGKPAAEVTLAEAAYLAAILQAPTYYSPYGSHREDLVNRQKLVLRRMKELGMISQTEHEAALNEKVNFLSRGDGSIRAPHFVMMVKEYLTNKFGEDEAINGGFRVITTLDYEMQQKGEEVINRFAPSLSENFNASNTAMVAIDPKTGDILTMIGSRDYFSDEIDGNFNVALAKRQPGSTYKPFVYATAFKKGYTPETILFDAETEFSTRCTVEGKPKNESDDPTKVCYSPDEYDHLFEGPMTIREALAKSRNVPAVKALYLAGIKDSIQTSEDMGITSLNDPDRYGLTLVLGGGEVSLLDLTSAYGVFANDGIRNPYRSVLRIEDSSGNIIEETKSQTFVALQPEIARQVSDILSDNRVRMNSLRPIADSIGRQVAIKTGTTNDYRDVWTVGYTPNLVVGAWGGKNDNTPLKQNVAGLIISPVWGAFMSQVIQKFPDENFNSPPPPLADTEKPVLRGIWYGGQSYVRDRVSGKLATEFTPPEAREEVVAKSVHTILHWVNKDDPRGPVPADPKQDSQYEYWEYSVRKWFDEYQKAHPDFKENTEFTIPTATDDVHTGDKKLNVSIVSPSADAVINPRSQLNIKLQAAGSFAPLRAELYVNNKYVLTDEHTPLEISFIPQDVGNLSKTNTISVVLFDTAFNQGRAQVTFKTE